MCANFRHTILHLNKTIRTPIMQLFTLKSKQVPTGQKVLKVTSSTSHQPAYLLNSLVVALEFAYVWNPTDPQA